MSAENRSSLQIGDKVLILDLEKPGHVRTPVYVRSKVGQIERFCGTFENPEERAYGRLGGERLPLYLVRFSQRELWPDYQGPTGDTLVLGIYAHWLKPIEIAA
ncbi:SH3-like domain-containing protein [Faunimonas sp. B44]|uniref:SH3-like domain-containing protein n=1 Tax=Faunimonas sp. B44 TaxID=3461493 RepID=UPI004044148C